MKITARWRPAGRIGLVSVAAAMLVGVGGGALGAVPDRAVGAPVTNGNLQASATISKTDAWAVGYSLTSDTFPLAEHWNGKKYVPVPVPLPDGTVSGMLNGVTAVASDDVWAVGQAATASSDTWAFVSHWDGTSWTSTSTAAPKGSTLSVLTGVSAVSADDVWAAGYSFDSQSQGHSMIMHWNGRKWSLSPNKDVKNYHNFLLYGVTATSADDVWVAGSYLVGGTGVTYVKHWNGKKWSVVTTPNPQGSTDTEFRAVTSTSADDAWASGLTWTGTRYLPFSEHWDGSSWTAVDMPAGKASTDNWLYGVTAIAADDVWATGYYNSTATGTYRTLTEHWDGTAWRIVKSWNDKTPGSYNSLYAASSDATGDVWAVGTSVADRVAPTAIRWTGTKWKAATVK